MDRIYHGYVDVMAVSPNNYDKIYGAGHMSEGSELVPAFHKSTNGGKSWASYQMPFDSATFYDIAVNPNNENVMYVGGSFWDSMAGGGEFKDSAGSKIYRTQNGGKNWNGLGQNINYFVYSIAIDPDNPNNVYAGTASGVYRSTNSGNSFTAPAYPFNFNVDCVAIYPNDTDIIFAGGWHGVHYSPDKGKTWVEANNGLKVKSIKFIAFNTKDKIVYVATDGGGLYWNKKLLKKIK